MNSEDLKPFMGEDGKIRCPCGGEDFSVTASDGTPQPEPYNPLTNLHFICKKCKQRGFTLKDTYPISHTMDFGDDDIVKTEEIRPMPGGNISPKEDSNGETST